jgi:glycosyltransferase involved in cell wall biosynthesis
MWQTARVAVIVPAHDEALLIARMLDRIPAFVDAIYVVDDASQDATAQIVEQRCEPRITLLRHALNRGVGAAIVTGYRAALEGDAEIFVVMAGDDQMHPDDLEPVIEPIVSGRADYVKGNRFAHALRRHMPFARRTAGQLLSSLTRLTTGLSVNDTQCGYTALSRAAARCLPLAELWPGYGYPNDLLGLLAVHGLRVVEVSVRPVYADERSGVRPWHVFSVAHVITRRWWLNSRHATRRLHVR